MLFSLASQYGANTLETTRALEKALAQLTPALKAQGITIYPAMHRPANFIERALAILEQSLVIAAILILAVLYLFLRDWRSALITFLSIPLSLLAAVAVLDRMGLTLNTMTLGGFAVALGVLVDDAIIGIENILRRLRENAQRPQPRSRLAGHPRRDPGSARTGGLRHPGRHRGLPARAFLHQRAGPFRRAAGAGLHPGGAGLAAGGADRLAALCRR